MLNDSESPQNALQSLLVWQALPETQEVLKLLKDKADLADLGLKRGPLGYRDNVDGRVLDGDTITQLRCQFIGEEKGLRELSRLLTERELTLREKLKQQQQDTSK